MSDSEMPWDELCRSEVDTLLRYLNKNRDAVVRASEGLTDEECRRAMVPSGTSLLGMIRHLTIVERHWFRAVFRGEEIAFDPSWEVPAGMSRDDVVADYRAECARSDEIVRSCRDMSEMGLKENPGEVGLDSIRVITAHMIEETARHAGQADVLRELIDGATEL